MAQRVAREVVDKLRMPEPHFDLSRVHVDVDFLVRQFEEQQHNGENSRRRHVAIRLVNRMQQQPVAHQAPVDENVDAVAVRALHLRTRRESRDAQRGRLLVCLDLRLGDRGTHRSFARWNLDQFVERLPPEELIHTLGKFLHRRTIKNQLRRRLEHKMRFGMGQRVVRDERGDVAKFGRLGFQKFAPRRHAVKNVRDTNRSSRRQSGRLYSDEFAAGEFDPGSLIFLGRARFEQQPRNRRDRRQRLSAKSQRRD